MHCAFCKNEIPDQVKFCPICGAPQQPAEPAEPIAPAEIAPEPASAPQEAPRLEKPENSIGQRLWGLLFLLAAVVAGLTPGWMRSLYSSDLQELYALGSSYISAIPVFTSFLNLLNTFVFMMLALICLTAGLSLLMGCSGARKAAITATVFQGFTLVYTLAMLIVCTSVPQALMNMLNIPKQHINEAATYIRSESGLSKQYLYTLLSQAAAFALFIFSDTRLRIRGQKLDRSIAGLLITLPFLAQVLSITGNMDSSFINMYGRTQVLAYSIATNAIYDTLPQSALWIWLALILTVGLLLRKRKFSILSLCAGAVVLVGTLWITLQADTEEAVEAYKALATEDLEAWVPRFMAMKLIGGAVMMLALSFWVAATAKGAIPLWVQIPVSILLFMLMFTLHYVANMVLHLPVWLPISKVITALILGAISVPLSLRADKKLLSSQKV